MNVRSAQIHLALSLAIACSSIFVGCDKNRPSSAQNQIQPEMEPQSPGPTTDPKGLSRRGTGDSGGGNGVDGLVFESYTVDPSKLPAYTKYLKPFFDRLNSTNPKGSGFEKALKFRTWYLAPIELEKIDDGVLGISFSKSNTQQLAIQTQKEIWINKVYFEKMDEKSQAELILHEMIMSLYFLKHMKMTDFCKLTLMIDPHSLGDDVTWCSNADMDEFYPAIPWKPLDGKDYQNIRSMTSWVISHLDQKISEKTFFQTLRYYNFDKRIFSNPDGNDSEETSSQEKTIELSSKDLLNLLGAAQKAHQLPTECQAKKLKDTQSCFLKFSEVQIPFVYNGYSVQQKGLQLELGLENGQKHKFVFFVGESVSLTPFQNSDRKKIYSMVLIQTFGDKDLVGKEAVSGQIYFEGSAAEHLPLKVHSIWLKSGVISSARLKGNNLCSVQAYLPTNFFEDEIKISFPGSPTLPVGVISMKSHPMAACLGNSSETGSETKDSKK